MMMSHSLYWEWLLLADFVAKVGSSRWAVGYFV
jgi:hypothetical protein